MIDREAEGSDSLEVCFLFSEEVNFAYAAYRVSWLCILSQEEQARDWDHSFWSD